MVFQFPLRDDSAFNPCGEDFLYVTLWFQFPLRDDSAFNPALILTPS